MKKHFSDNRVAAPLGMVEPHKMLLTIPPSDLILYKVMSIENMLRSIKGGYLYFNRVDSYKDFSGADINDGKQLPKDHQGNIDTTFLNDTEYSAASYYDQSRSRTYACCFSMENSKYIWENYGNGSLKGKACIVFKYQKLREILNQTFQPGNVVLEYEGDICHQIFSVNYGVVEYVNWNEHRENKKLLPNPIRYTYLKDKERYSKEKELRVSLSAIGIGDFAMNDGRIVQFPPSLQQAFNFKRAIADKTIQEIMHAADSDSEYLKTELHNLQIDQSC